MASRKPRRQNNHNPVNLTDYESDAYNSDMPQQPAPPLRSNEELNLSVIHRHKPSVTRILSLAPYAVVYIFSPTTNQWEKNGVEGTLFVCEETQGELGEHRYSAFVLNRRGLSNFDLSLTDGENVEITDDDDGYVILKADEATKGEAGQHGIADPLHPQAVPSDQSSTNNVRIYGLWIYSEPLPNSTTECRTINANMIKDCASHAGQSLKLARERLESMRQSSLHAAAAAASNQVHPLQGTGASEPMGRQISLRDLFGQQRAQDDSWSVHAHQPGPGQPQPQHTYGGGMMPQHVPAPPHPPQPQGDVLGDLFRRAGLAYQGPPEGR